MQLNEMFHKRIIGTFKFETMLECIKYNKIEHSVLPAWGWEPGSSALEFALL